MRSCFGRRAICSWPALAHICIAYGHFDDIAERVGNKKLQNSYKLVTNSYKIVTNCYKMVTFYYFLPQKLQNYYKKLQKSDKIITKL